MTGTNHTTNSNHNCNCVSLTLTLALNPDPNLKTGVNNLTTNPKP